MREVVSGVGPWRIVFYDGQARRVEVQGADGRTMVVGQRPFVSRCARCGVAIRTTSPENEDMDCCEACEDAIEREIREGTA